MNNNSSEVKKPLNKNERIEVSKEFKNQLQVVFNDYIKIKNALAINDIKELKNQSKLLLKNVTKVDMKLLNDKKAHQHWMSSEKEIKAMANLMLNTADITMQRTYFKHLSSNMINILEVFGVNKEVYLLFCPMSDNNKGAYWLSTTEKVVNPYFGGAMLTCGDVKQVIK
jgi:Cu(I)/Ag(I) efflux system membrane fusion protein